MNRTRTPRARAEHREFSGRAASRTLLVWAALLTAILLGLASARTDAGTPTHVTSIGGLALPEYIGPLEYIGEHSGPEGERSMSYSYRAVGLALEISVTDLGEGGVPDGTGAAQLVQRYNEAKHDVVVATKIRRLKPRYEKEVTLGNGASARAAREAMFTVQERDGAGGTTWLTFTAAHGLVIDARFDVIPGLEEDGMISHGEILEALGAAIPVSSAPVAEARARLAAEAEAASKVAIVWDPATPREESRLWLAYLYARAVFAVRESNGDLGVGERDATFEEEVRGRTTAVSMFRALKHSDVPLESAYFSDIERVDDAGFLREYVWSYLHRDSWVAVPAGLNMRAFDSWRETNLADHKPVTHGRISFRIAAAPVSPRS